MPLTISLIFKTILWPYFAFPNVWRVVYEVLSRPLSRSTFTIRRLRLVSSYGAFDGGTAEIVKVDGPKVELRPYFKLVFLSVLFITLSSGAVTIVMAILWAEPTANQQATFEQFGFAWKAGLGAIFGLLGGKVT